MPQTSVASALTIGAAGMLASHDVGTELDQFALKNSSAIAKGLGVVHDAANGDDCCKLPGASTDAILGVAYDDGSLNTDETTYEQYDSVPVVRKGRVYVVTEEAVAPTDPVYLRYTANGAGKDVGQFRKDDDTGKAAQIANAQWKQTTSGSGIALLEINLP